MIEVYYKEILAVLGNLTTYTLDSPVQGSPGDADSLCLWWDPSCLDRFQEPCQ